MQRDPTDFPVQYLGANVPQAWAAGSCFAMLQMIVGFQPDAPAGKLYIDPALPEWLPELTIRDLQVGENVFDLRFWRDDDATRFETLKGDPRRRRPEELRHGHHAMAVARYQKTQRLKLDQLSHDIPQFGNYLLLEPRIFLHPNCATPTRMRQREELGTVL